MYDEKPLIVEIKSVEVVIATVGYFTLVDGNLTFS